MKSDPLDGFNGNMRRALTLMQGVSVLSRGHYVPAGRPSEAIDPQTIGALAARGCIAWINQNGRRDAALSQEGRALQLIIARREGAARNIGGAACEGAARNIGGAGREGAARNIGGAGREGKTS